MFAQLATTELPHSQAAQIVPPGSTRVQQEMENVHHVQQDTRHQMQEQQHVNVRQDTMEVELLVQLALRTITVQLLV